jgi:hypothetical protein
MANEEKHFVFSARTTEEGLRRLNQLKAERGLPLILRQPASSVAQ